MICIPARDCSRLYSAEAVPVRDQFRVAACVITEDSFEIIQSRFTSGKLPPRLEVWIWMDEHKQTHANAVSLAFKEQQQ